MRIEDLKRQYLAAYPEGPFFDNGGWKNCRWFPSRTVYGGKYFIEGSPDVLTYKVWGIVTEPRFRFEPVRSFHSLEDARDHARALAQENK
jgi:hypothetical protein